MISKCRKHYRYRAIRKPRCLCEDCWKYWFYRQSTLEDLQGMEHQKIMERHLANDIKKLSWSSRPWADIMKRGPFNT